MRERNLFWPVFKNIEKEIISLSNEIHFDDKQLSVYSVKIAELLLRCVVEIEAIAKELYFENGGEKPENDKDLYFDTDCLNLLETKWQLSKKQVVVSSANFYFREDKNIVLYPLQKANKRGTSGVDWAKAYQSVKHNRTKELEKANLKNLLRATAALYMLNLYYRNDVFDLVDTNTNNFSHTFSDIFDVKVHSWAGERTDNFQSYHKKEDFDNCIYLIKQTDEVHLKIFNHFKYMNQKRSELLLNHPNIQKHIKDNFILSDGKLNTDEFSVFFEKEEYLKLINMDADYVNILATAKLHADKESGFRFNQICYEAVLNKNQEIYQSNESKQ